MQPHHWSVTGWFVVATAVVLVLLGGHVIVDELHFERLAGVCVVIGAAMISGVAVLVTKYARSSAQQR